MLTKDERQLLDNVLDAFDRLHDNCSTVADVHALLVATSVALGASSLSAPFSTPIRALQELVRSNVSPDQKRDMALNLTDDLRVFIAERLRRDSMENRRQRHV